MKNKHIQEDALARQLTIDEIAIGEQVIVITKMGNFVVSGHVQAVYKKSKSVLIRIDDGTSNPSQDQIYDTRLYSFAEIESLDEAEPDIVPAESDPVEEPSKEPVSKSDKLKKLSKANAPTGIDVSKLPKGVQKKISGLEELDSDQVERVLSQISDAALRSLKTVGLKDTDVYQRIIEIQKAVAPIIKGSTKLKG